MIFHSLAARTFCALKKLLLAACCCMAQSHATTFSFQETYNPITRKTTIAAHDTNGQQCGEVIFNKNDGWIDHLEVNQLLRRQGLGSQLFKRAISAIPKEHEMAGWLALEPSIDFYKKQGALVSLPHKKPIAVEQNGSIIRARYMHIELRQAC